MEQEKLEVDKSNLAAALREKTRKHNQTYELYERLKRKEMAAKTQNAAFDTADDVLHSAMGLPPEQATRYDLGVANDSHRRAGSDGSAGRSRMMAPPPRPANFGNPALRASRLSIHVSYVCLNIPQGARVWQRPPSTAMCSVAPDLVAYRYPNQDAVALE